MNGRDVVRLGLLSAPRRPIVTKHAHRTFGISFRVNCSCATRKQLRGPLLSVKNASPCADLELATHRHVCERPWELEEELISTFNLPLNLDMNVANTFHPVLSELQARPRRTSLPWSSPSPTRKDTDTSTGS